MRGLLAGMTGAVLLAGAASEVPIEDLDYDQLVSLVMFENETAYGDPTGYFCKFIALADKDDYCRASLTSLDPKLCKVEIKREFRATYATEREIGREFMRVRDVFLLSSLDLGTLGAPEVDKDKGTSRQSFEGKIDVHLHEGEQYSTLLDEHGAYRACRIAGETKDIPEAECESRGKQPTTSSRHMALLFNSQNFSRAMAALAALQKSHCPAGGDDL